MKSFFVISDYLNHFQVKLLDIKFKQLFTMPTLAFFVAYDKKKLIKYFFTILPF